jgi:hypothetical protein
VLVSLSLVDPAYAESASPASNSNSVGAATGAGGSTGEDLDNQQRNHLVDLRVKLTEVAGALPAAAIPGADSGSAIAIASNILCGEEMKSTTGSNYSRVPKINQKLKCGHDYAGFLNLSNARTRRGPSCTRQFVNPSLHAADSLPGEHPVSINQLKCQRIEFDSDVCSKRPVGNASWGVAEHPTSSTPVIDTMVRVSQRRTTMLDSKRPLFLA